MPGGQQINVGQGDLEVLGGVDKSRTLSGESVSVASGEVGWHPDDSDTDEGIIHGQTVEVGQGSLTFRSERGQQISLTQGTLVPDNPQKVLSGGEISVGLGTVTAEGQGVTVHITGSEFTSQLGSVGIGPTGLTGSEASFGDGSLGNSREVGPITTENGGDGPLPISVTQGILTPNLDADDTLITSAFGVSTQTVSVALTGTEIVSASGALSTTGVVLSGQEITSAQETLEGLASQSLSGLDLTFAQSNVGAPAGGVLSGVEIATGQNSFGRSIELTGSEASFDTGSIVGLPGVVALEGSQITVGQGRVGIEGTNWSETATPTTPWVKSVAPSSTWTKRSGPATSWRSND